MASLNLSTNGPSISKSYQSVVNAPPASGPAAQSPTYGQWAVFSVTAPLANAFQQDTAGKESVLKVQSSGEGDLADLIDEFSDGRIQFAFAKVKDPNTTLAKSVLIGWCGEGVPERTKGYFTSHLAAVSKTLQGYHVQITARSDRDLTPESIVQKVSEASGSKYGGGPAANITAPPPPVASKPAFTPTRNSAAATGGFNPLAGARSGSNIYKNQNSENDGWGDAPPVTRSELEKVPSAYQPTKVNLRDIGAQQAPPSILSSKPAAEPVRTGEDVVRGGYQPVGKVDIAAIRRQAQQQGSTSDRPEPVKGAYEPVGKVDIAAIRARAQPQASTERASPAPPPEDKSLPDRSAPFMSSERMTTMPKPKIANRFGSGASSFGGTKAPTPGGFDSQPTPAGPPMGVGRTFADQGGKTPAQLWAEKRAKAQGSGAAAPPSSVPQTSTPLQNQASGDGQWKSGYQGKSWAPVQTMRTGQSSNSLEQQTTGEREEESSAADDQASFGGVGALRDRFKNAPLPRAEESAPPPPPLDTSNKPNAGRGVPMPGLPSRPSVAEEDTVEESPSMPSPPPQPPRSPTPPTPPAVSGSPIRIAMPVGRGTEVENARDEQTTPPPAMPTRSLTEAVPHEDDLDEPEDHDPARAAAVATAANTFGAEAAETAHPGAEHSGKRATVLYDYEIGEDNEINLREGEEVTDIEMVDENWWMGTNVHGASGLFPKDYVELVDEHAAGPAAGHAGPPPPHEPEPEQGATATALYDYEAGEDNELTFTEGAKITGVEFPDKDWWSGEYNGRQGLFPADYVQLDQ